MKELRDIVSAWRCASPEADMVLATVIEIKGSSYRRPGAHLLIVGADAYGSISGGCLEAELVSTAWERTANGPCTLIFDTTQDEDAMFGYGLGCRGIVTVFLRRIGIQDSMLSIFEKHLVQRFPTEVRTTIEGDDPGFISIFPRSDLEPAPCGLRTGLSEVDGNLIFTEELEPLTSVHVYGAGFDALPLVAIASQLGWETHVSDRRPALANRKRFPDATSIECIDFRELRPLGDDYSAHVVMTHNFENDLQVLEKLVSIETIYLGVLGPKARTVRLLEQLKKLELRDKIRSPIGLDLGAETPQEIALAVVAEIQAVLRSREAGFLKDRATRVHREPITP